MVRSVQKKENDVESPTSMDNILDQDSSCGLLHLPNELLEMIFSCLSSRDLVQSFFEINSNRMQNLISKYLVHFNLVSVIVDEQQWIRKYFVDQSRLSHCIISLCLTDRQMNIFSRYNIQFVQLKSLNIVEIRNNNVLRLDLLKLSPLLRSLSLDYLSDDMSHDDRGCLARILFNSKGTWQQQIEILLINKIYVPFGFQSLQLMVNLSHLTISIRYENQLFNLCSYLPRLETFCVDVLRPSADSADQSISTSNVSIYLKKLIISGNFFSYLSLYRFILIYKISLEDLTLKNVHQLDQVNGQQLQSELIEHLSSSVRFRFHFQFSIKSEEFQADEYMKTFSGMPAMVSSKIDDMLIIITVSSLSA